MRQRIKRPRKDKGGLALAGSEQTSGKVQRASPGGNRNPARNEKAPQTGQCLRGRVNMPEKAILQLCSQSRIPCEISDAVDDGKIPLRCDIALRLAGGKISLSAEHLPSESPAKGITCCRENLERTS